MAYSSEQWERAKAYYEAGQHTPQQISDIVGIERSTIVKKAKIHNWENGINSDYIEAKTKIAVKKSQLNSQTLQVLDDIADETIRRKNLINSNAELLARQIPKVVNSFITKQINEDTGKEEEICMLEAKTIKELAEANDKLAVTLKVGERHANQQINVNTQNNVGIQTITRKIID